MSSSSSQPLRVAFVVGDFPLASQTFIINQVADLLERGVQVEVLAYGHGQDQNISERFSRHGMGGRVRRLRSTATGFRRIGEMFAGLVQLGRYAPGVLLRWLGRACLAPRGALDQLVAARTFAGQSFDVVHCHFGGVAVEYLKVRRLLRDTTPLVTSFYGVDVSWAFAHEPVGYYDRLMAECRLFYVMSRNMRDRVVAHGFDAARVKVHPVSIDVASYPYAERTAPAVGPVEILAVGRCVEKKGFDDLLAALALARPRCVRPLHCSIVGDGPLLAQLQETARKLSLEDIVSFRGAMKIEDIIELMRTMHVLVAPSKTAKNGDME